MVWFGMVCCYRALQDVNVPTFLAHDLPLFIGILSDLFPGIERPAFDYGPLLLALKESIHEKNLQPVQIFLRKNIELYEMICVRHGLMVVGPTGGGKVRDNFSIMATVSVQYLMLNILSYNFLTFPVEQYPCPMQRPMQIES